MDGHIETRELSVKAMDRRKAEKMDEDSRGESGGGLTLINDLVWVCARVHVCVCVYLGVFFHIVQ